MTVNVLANHTPHSSVFGDQGFLPDLANRYLSGVSLKLLMLQYLRAEAKRCGKGRFPCPGIEREAKQCKDLFSSY